MPHWIKVLVLWAAAAFPWQGIVLGPPHYVLRVAVPNHFELLRWIQVPPIYVLKQNGAIVETSPGAPAPDTVTFLFATGGSYTLPISQATLVGPNRWRIVTPMVMIPNLLPQPIGVQAGQGPNHSRRVLAILR